MGARIAPTSPTGCSKLSVRYRSPGCRVRRQLCRTKQNRGRWSRRCKKIQARRLHGYFSARLVTVGNSKKTAGESPEVDWIIEAVVENLDLKRALLRKVGSIRKRGTIIAPTPAACPSEKLPKASPTNFAAPGSAPLLQPAALHAPARTHPHPEARRCPDRSPSRTLRRSPRQRRDPCQRHTQFHRQPHRYISVLKYAPHARDGPEHRRSRRAHRTSRRVAEIRNLPHH